MGFSRRSVVQLAIAWLLCGGCGDSKAIVVVQDAGSPPKHDGNIPVTDLAPSKPDAPPAQASALQVVINSLTLPKSAEEYARDLDGRNGNDNQLGAIIGLMNTFAAGSFDFQGSINDMLTKGEFLMLLDLQATNITNAPDTTTQAFLGLDQDFPADPTDNFSGTEEFAIQPDSPEDLILQGSITAGKLEAGPGTLVIPIPLGDQPVNVTITSAYITADLSEQGMPMGQINGAIPWSEVDGKIIPGLATLLNPMYAEMEDGFLKDLLKGQFDYQAGSEGVITPDEIRGSPILSMVLKADVDTDGDTVDDAMSLGLGFTAVSCKIKH